MNKTLKRIRGALGMGLIWAVAWAPVALIIGLIVDPDGSMDEMWPAIGAYPGFLGGVLFAVILGIVARRRRFDELSVGRFAAWGAAAGLLVGSLPFLLAGPAGEGPALLVAGGVVGVVTAMSALSAAGSLVLARMAERRELTAFTEPPLRPLPAARAAESRRPRE